MQISGIQKFSMLDFPGRTACIVFTPGCNFRCGMCHNSEFVLPEEIAKIKKSFIPEKTFFNFLKKRKGLLDGVVISGGEPTLQKNLAEFCQKIKNMGFLVKLDTNGSRSVELKNLFKKKLLDFVAMDIKTSLAKYKEFSGDGVLIEDIKKSVRLIIESSLEYEFRSTLIHELHPPEVLEDMAKLISGAKNIYLQIFRPQKTLDLGFERYHAFSDNQLQAAQKVFSKYVQEVHIRI